MKKKKIGVCTARGYIAGVNSIIRGLCLAARAHKADVIGIKDGFDGLLLPKSSKPGCLELSADLCENLDFNDNMLGTNPQTDPFRMRSIKDGQVEEIDRSEELIDRIKQLEIDTVIVIGGSQSLTTLAKLSKKGLPCICIPLSVENDIAATQLSFGFNTALSFTADMLGRAAQAAKAAGKIGIVEVLGAQSGWLALQGGLSVCADAILIPERKYDIKALAQHFSNRSQGLIVAAEGAVEGSTASPSADSKYVIDHTGKTAETVSRALQKYSLPTYPLVLGTWSKGGSLTAVDRQLGLAYAAAALEAALHEQTGTMVAFEPPDIKHVPISQTVNKIRRVPQDSIFIKTAGALGIYTGERT